MALHFSCDFIMSLTVTTRGPFFSKSQKFMVGKAVRGAFDQLGERLVSGLKADAPSDTDKFKKSIRAKVTGQAFNTKLTVSSNLKHAKYVEEGRRPGKAPPPAVMLRLVKRKGLGASAFSVKTRRQISAGTRRIRSRAAGNLRTRARSLAIIQKSIAFLIGRSIGKKGTKGSWLFRDMRTRHAGAIAAAYRQMELRVAQVLNNG